MYCAFEEVQDSIAMDGARHKTMTQLLRYQKGARAIKQMADGNGMDWKAVTPKYRVVHMSQLQQIADLNRDSLPNYHGLFELAKHFVKFLLRFDNENVWMAQFFKISKEVVKFNYSLGLVSNSTRSAFRRKARRSVH